MDGIGVAFHAILAIMGGIATIGGGTAVLMRWLNPYRKMRQSVTRQGELLDRDQHRLDDIDEYNRVMGGCMLALLHHEITGNDVKKLEDAKAKLQEYLLSR